MSPFDNLNVCWNEKPRHFATELEALAASLLGENPDSSPGRKPGPDANSRRSFRNWRRPSKKASVVMVIDWSGDPVLRSEPLHA